MLAGNALVIALYPMVSHCRDGWGAFQFSALEAVLDAEGIDGESRADVIRKVLVIESALAEHRAKEEQEASKNA